MQLRDLKDLSGTELDALYASATTPSVQEIEGEYDGLLLVGEFPPSSLQFGIRLVNRPWLPWKGKIFFPASGVRGAGANRFSLGGRRLQTWRFETAIIPSMFGDDSALLIDYDIDGNPSWLRKGVFDELKKIDDDLFLGKGGVKLLGQNRFVFTWAMGKS